MTGFFHFYGYASYIEAQYAVSMPYDGLFSFLLFLMTKDKKKAESCVNAL